MNELIEEFGRQAENEEEREKIENKLYRETLYSHRHVTEDEIPITELSSEEIRALKNQTDEERMKAYYRSIIFQRNGVF